MKATFSTSPLFSFSFSFSAASSGCPVFKTLLLLFRNRYVQYYMKRFAKTVVKVLTAYADLLKNDFPNHLRDERTVRQSLCRKLGLRIRNKIILTSPDPSLSFSQILYFS